MTGIETAALIAMAASAAVSAAGAIQQGYAQNEQAQYNAAVARNNAISARAAAALEESNIRKKNERTLGTIRARGASDTGDLGGSALEVLGESAGEAELEALTARYTGAIQGQRYDSEEKLQRKRGRDAITQGWIGAGTQLLQAGTKAYSGMGATTGSASGIPPLGSGLGMGPSSGFGGPR